MHLCVDFKLTGPVSGYCRDIESLSRPTVVFSYVAEVLSGCDMSQVKLVSRQLDLVATSFH